MHPSSALCLAISNDGEYPLIYFVVFPIQGENEENTKQTRENNVNNSQNNVSQKKSTYR